MQWAKIQWPDHPPLHIDAIGRRVGGNLQAEIERLHERLYGRESADWNGAALWAAFEIDHKKSTQQVNKPQFELEPLYKV